MKHTFKKITAMLLVIAMIVGIVPSVLATQVGPFTDVDSASWYAEEVLYVYEEGLMKGMTPTTFEPETKVSRAMAVTVLYRIEGEPVIDRFFTFTDVPTDRWFTIPIAWAQDEGIVNGRTPDTFDPDALVTREEMVTMLYRYAGWPEIEGEHLSDFPDAANVGNFAKYAMQWAVDNGIINGMDGKLNPKGTATRAQLATILMRYYKLICEHVWDEGEVKTAATCTAAGEMTYICTKCDETKVEAIPTTGHSWDEGVETIPVTCEYGGEITYTCTICGETKVDGIYTFGHSWNEGVVTKAATCTATGEKTCTCTICGKTIVELIPVLGHDYVDGVCTRCGYVLNRRIGATIVDLKTGDSTGRLVRRMETNLGDFTADALYYLFDVTEGLDVDVAIMNGGGIRADMNTGDIFYNTCMTVHTFGSVACLMTVTGQQILDALEWGARSTPTGETGSFLQVAGLTYEIHTYITSTVQQDANQVWTGAPTGEYRVKNVQIWNKETGEYEALDLNASYNLAGYDLTLCNLVDGFAMFTGATPVKDHVMEDYMVLANYVKSFPVDATSGLPTITANNSVLGSDYSDIYGEGRIVIVNE